MKSKMQDINTSKVRKVTFESTKGSDNCTTNSEVLSSTALHTNTNTTQSSKKPNVDSRNNDKINLHINPLQSSEAKVEEMKKLNLASSPVSSLSCEKSACTEVVDESMNCTTNVSCNNNNFVLQSGFNSNQITNVHPLKVQHSAIVPVSSSNMIVHATWPVATKNLEDDVDNKFTFYPLNHNPTSSLPANHPSRKLPLAMRPFIPMHFNNSSNNIFASRMLTPSNPLVFGGSYPIDRPISARQLGSSKEEKDIASATTQTYQIDEICCEPPNICKDHIQLSQIMQNADHDEITDYDNGNSKIVSNNVISSPKNNSFSSSNNDITLSQCNDDVCKKVKKCRNYCSSDIKKCNLVKNKRCSLPSVPVITYPVDSIIEDGYLITNVNNSYDDEYDHYYQEQEYDEFGGDIYEYEYDERDEEAINQFDYEAGYGFYSHVKENSSSPLPTAVYTSETPEPIKRSNSNSPLPPSPWNTPRHTSYLRDQQHSSPFLKIDNVYSSEIRSLTPSECSSPRSPKKLTPRMSEHEDLVQCLDINVKKLKEVPCFRRGYSEDHKNTPTVEENYFSNHEDYSFKNSSFHHKILSPTNTTSTNINTTTTVPSPLPPPMTFTGPGMQVLTNSCKIKIITKINLEHPFFFIFIVSVYIFHLLVYFFVLFIICFSILGKYIL